MVFESLVADLLNKYLGDYVENLDKSQLNIGIWGGDVVLKNLELKASALDDLNLPVKVVAGHLGTLILKIPWKNIYTQPLEVVIEDLFAIAAPNAGQKYDEAKEAQALLDKKTKQLNRVESLKLAVEASAKESGKKGDSFAEKLATQVVKNLQVKVNNIHIRYEDSYTTPSQPFAIGITLDSLSFQTVDEAGNPKVVKETVQKLFKCAKLQNLALYWNSNSSSYLRGAKESIYQTLKTKIATRERKVKDHQFLIRPINCTINMELDTHPERSGFTSPKLAMNLVLEEIALQLSKTQYYDIMEMLQSFERMVLADKFRKYRQYLPAKPSRKQMWKYAYTCVLEEDVKRRRRMWSWIHMQRLKQLKVLYKEAYRKKLESSKKQSEVYKVIEQCEKELDVFNIILMRSQAEMAFARAQKEKSKGGLFSFLKGKKSKSSEKGFKDQINEVMTKEEYDKLYQAIGYEESEEGPNALPPDYVAHKLHFELHTLSLTLQDQIEKKTCKLLCVEISNMAADVLQKPTSGYLKQQLSLRLKATMGSFGIHGLAHDTVKPMIVRSLAQQGSHLLDVDFELKPADKSCDQRVHITARPTEIVYDAMTINHVVSFFKPPEHVKLKQLSKAAVSRYRKLKEQSTAGLKDIVQHHKYTEVKVAVDASYILIPETGTYRQGETNVILIDLGQLSVMSEKDPEAPKKYRAKAALMKARRTTDKAAVEQDKMLETVMEKAYDSFTFHLDQFQVLYANKGSDWAALRKQKSSPLHIIQPMGYSVLLQKCMIVDPRLPNIKVNGKLPQVLLTLSDEKILNLTRLVLSISLPDAALPGDSDDEDSDYHSFDGFEDSKDVILEERDEMLADEAEEVKDKSKVIDNATNMTEVDMSFEIEEIEVKVSQTVLGKEVPFVKLKLDSIGTQVKVRSFDIVVQSYLGGLYLQHLLFKVPDSMLEWINNQSPRKHKQAVDNGPVVNLINTPVDESQGDRLLTVDFVMAHNDNPEFASTYKNTEKVLKVDFSQLEVLLHETALLTIMSFAQNLVAKVKALTPDTSQPEVETRRRRHSSMSDVVEYLGRQATKNAMKLMEPRVIQAEIIRFQVDAKMETFEVSVCTEKTLITHMNIQGFDVGVCLQDSQTEVKAKLTNIEVLDPEPTTCFPKVVSIAGDEVFNMTLTLYNKATRGTSRYANMNNVDTRIVLDVNSIRFIFLYRYVSQLISFVNQFDVAKQRAMELGAKAGEMAIDAAQSLHGKAVRLALAITVNAPIITIPSNSTSHSALIAHLGVVSVHNTFSLTSDKAKSKDGVPAVLDCMNVSLTKLQVQRAVLNVTNTSEVKAVCNILEPVDMNVNIVRNLASAWYHKVPLVDIKGGLPTVKVTCSQGDFSVLMKILHENLAEGVDPDDLVAKPQAPTGSKAKLDTSSPVVPMVAMTAAAELYAEVKVLFEVGLLEAVLYTGETNFAETVKGSSGVDVASRQASKSLANFSISTLSANFERNSDSSMKAKLQVFDCNLDDTRPIKAKGVSKSNESIRMIERVTTGGTDLDPMINLTFTQEADLRKTVDVHLNKLFIIIAIPYLMEVANFFQQGMPEVDKTQKKAVSQSKDAISQDMSKDTLGSAETVINVHVKHPEIILVEDTGVKSTNALILDTGATFQMRLSSQAIKFSAGLELQIISAKYRIENKEYVKMAQIMMPCTINAYGSAPDNAGMHIDISLTNIDVCVSPAIISTISKIATNLQMAQTEGSDGGEGSFIKNLWVVEKVSEMSTWYLNTAPTDDDPMMPDAVTEGHRGEQMLVSAPYIVFKLEGGTGNKTVPLLVAELDVRAEVKDWSSKVVMESSVSLAVSYFNEKCSVWEPLLEPADDGRRTQPWTLAVQDKMVNVKLQLRKNDEYYTDADEDDSESDIIGQQPPKMTLNVTSDDSMQICLSKAGLDMMKSLTKAFGDAYKLVQPSIKAGDLQAPYTIRNDTGTLVAVTFDKQLEKVAGTEAQIHDNVVTLEPKGSVLLQQKKAVLKKSTSILKQAQEGSEIDLHVNMIEYDAVRDVVIQKAIKRCFHLFKRQDPHALVVETTADLGRRLITLRSDTEVVNDLDVVVSVLYMDSNDKMATLTDLQPAGRYNLPLPVVYGRHQALFFKPHVEGSSKKREKRLEMSGQSVKWKSLVKEGGYQLTSCVLSQKSYTYNIMVQTTIEPVYTESTGDRKSKCTVITLKAPVVFFNQLPYSIDIQLEKQPAVSLDSGKMAALHSVSPTLQLGQVTLRDYLGSDWTYNGIDSEQSGRFSIWTFRKSGSTSHSLKLAVLCRSDANARHMTLFSPYWFMNRTGLDLFYKDSSKKDEEILPHESSYNKPFLFSFKKIGSAEEKACMKISDSSWSDKFSLDTVGSSGTTSCKSEGLTYQVGVKITLSSNGLTKIVECSPYYVLVNNSSSSVTFLEQHSGGAKLTVAPSECLPFWPLPSKSKLMKIGVSDESDNLSVSSEFNFDRIHNTLLKLELHGTAIHQRSAMKVGKVKDKLGKSSKQRHICAGSCCGARGKHCHRQRGHKKCALNVEVTKSDLAIVVTVDDYRKGMEAARIINCTSDTLVTYHQQKCSHVSCLGPGESCIYAWDKPLDKRMFIWSAGMEADKQDELIKDGIGEFFADKDSNHKLFWVSFLDGMQRVLLFTEDFFQASRAQEAGEFERIDFEVVLSLEGAGVSMVDNESQREIAYLGVTSSGVVWEEKRKRRWKAFSNKLCESLEEAFVKYNMSLAADKQPSPLFTSDKLQVDLSCMRQLAPRKSTIRRTFQPGVWLQYKTSLHQTHLHTKVNRIQFDDQLPGAIYPVIFSPTPLPKSIAADSVPKPFVEASMVMRKHEHSDVQQIKYLKVLVQEMTVKADQGFINAIIAFFGAGKRSNEELSKDFESDLESLSRSLLDVSEGSAQSGHKNFYDKLHISPLKIHLSFSVGGAGSDGNTALQSEVLQLFLQSVGVVLTDVQDVVFRIAYFERNYVFFEKKTLATQISRHYAQQFIKQVYVLVLGLDVLGNPFGLIEGLADGAKGLFYEPIQGAIQGPEEFAEGLTLGLRSLLSGTVGGAAGAVSRITGTLGKGLAVISFDKQYQQRRREKMNKEPANIQESLFRGVEGLGMGFYDGVTGVVKKPFEGAKQEGVEGFFKGLGKGLIGVVARPTGGIVDFASSSFQGIRKATTLSQEVTRLRPPRIIRKDGVITPYNYRQAAGFAILKELAQGRYVVTDQFLCHGAVTADGSNVLLATDRRVLFAKRNELLVNWDVEWTYEWAELQEPPSVVERNKIKFMAKAEEKKKFSLFGKTSHGKLVPIADHKEAEWMVKQMAQAYHIVRQQV